MNEQENDNVSANQVSDVIENKEKSSNLVEEKSADSVETNETEEQILDMEPNQEQSSGDNNKDVSEDINNEKDENLEDEENLTNIILEEVKENSDDTNDPTEIEDEFTAASDSQSVNSQDNSEKNKDTNSESSQSENDETLIKDNISKALEENNTEAANNSTDMKDNEATDNRTDKDDNKERTSNDSSIEMEVDTVNDTQDKIETPAQDTNQIDLQTNLSAKDSTLNAIIDIENAEFEMVDVLPNSLQGPDSGTIKVESGIHTVKLEILQQPNTSSGVKEEYLAEDDNNIVGIISGVDSLHDVLEEDLGAGGAPVIDVKVKIEEYGKPIFNVQSEKKKSLKRKKYEEIVIDMDTAFTDQEDMALHALDLLSPYDIHFISNHLSKRTSREIEKRLDDNVFRKKHFLYQKIPAFLFCMTFYNNKTVKFRALVNITEKLFSLLICINKKCVHPEDIPEVTIDYQGSFKFGIDLNELVEFINENAPDRWKPDLFMTVEKLEEILVTSKLSFHKYGTSIGHVYSKTPKPRVQHKLKKQENPMKVIKGGRLQTDPEHDTTIIKLVSAVGQRWDTVLTLMNEAYGKIKAQGYKWTDEKLQKVIKDHYLCYLDDRKTEPFTEDEDKCLLFLHKFFFTSAPHMGSEDSRWKAIARHMEGRTIDDCRDRLKRKSTSKQELSLDNLDLADIHDDVPSLFYHNESHIFGLTIIPKDESIELLDVPTRLQMESRFLIAGTVDGVYVLPCKETAMRCMHQGMQTMQFTYNPAKPDSQFETYLKLTFSNELKRVGLIDEEMSQTFNFGQIPYCSKGIHQIIDKINNNRFILPREHFMSVNEKEDLKCTGGKRGFSTEAYYNEDF